MLDPRLSMLGSYIKKKKKRETNQKFNSGKNKALSFPSFIGQWIRML